MCQRLPQASASQATPAHPLERGGTGTYFALQGPGRGPPRNPGTDSL